MVTERMALAGALAFVMALCLAVQAAAAAGNMDDVRRLAQEPVETILSGAPIGSPMPTTGRPCRVARSRSS